MSNNDSHGNDKRPPLTGRPQPLPPFKRSNPLPQPPQRSVPPVQPSNSQERTQAPWQPQPPTNGNHAPNQYEQGSSPTPFDHGQQQGPFASNGQQYNPQVAQQGQQNNQQPQQDWGQQARQQYNPNQQGYNGQQPPYGNNGQWNSQTPPPKSYKKLFLIVGAVFAFIILIIIGLSVAIAASNKANQSEGLYSGDTGVTQDENGNAFDQTTFVFTQDDEITPIMDPATWEQNSNGTWNEPSGQCSVGFYPRKDGGWTTEFDGMSDAEARQIFYEDAGKVTYDMTQAEMWENQSASDLVIDNEVITLYSTPVVTQDGNNGWLGTTFWVDEGTYLDVGLNCKGGTTINEAETIWVSMLEDTILTTF